MATVTIPNFLTPKVVNGLNTYVYTTTTSAMHVARIDVPIIPPSGMSIVIKQNTTTIATSAAPAATQGAITMSATMNCTSGDTISFVLSSSTAMDEQLNTVKATLNVHIGSSN